MFFFFKKNKNRSSSFNTHTYVLIMKPTVSKKSNKKAAAKPAGEKKSRKKGHTFADFKKDHGMDMKSLFSRERSRSGKSRLSKESRKSIKSDHMAKLRKDYDAAVATGKTIYGSQRELSRSRASRKAMSKKSKMPKMSKEESAKHFASRKADKMSRGKARSANNTWIQFVAKNRASAMTQLRKELFPKAKTLNAKQHLKLNSSVLTHLSPKYKALYPNSGSKKSSTGKRTRHVAPRAPGSKKVCKEKKHPITGKCTTHAEYEKAVKEMAKKRNESRKALKASKKSAKGSAKSSAKPKAAAKPKPAKSASKKSAKSAKTKKTKKTKKTAKTKKANTENDHLFASKGYKTANNWWPFGASDDKPSKGKGTKSSKPKHKSAGYAEKDSGKKMSLGYLLKYY